MTDAAHQPRNFTFPKRSFGSKAEMRSFKPGWFDKWPWLDCCETSGLGWIAAKPVTAWYVFTAHVRAIGIFYQVDTSMHQHFKGIVYSYLQILV